MAILWEVKVILADSFGNMLAPYFHATFKNTINISRYLRTDDMVQILKAYKHQPIDYVIYLNVERLVPTTDKQKIKFSIPARIDLTQVADLPKLIVAQNQLLAKLQQAANGQSKV